MSKSLIILTHRTLSSALLYGKRGNTLHIKCWKWGRLCFRFCGDTLEFHLSLSPKTSNLWNGCLSKTFLVSSPRLMNEVQLMSEIMPWFVVIWTFNCGCSCAPQAIPKLESSSRMEEPMASTRESAMLCPCWCFHCSGDKLCTETCLLSQVLTF